MSAEIAAQPRPVLVVGNYPPDRQESMLRFARMLVDGLRAAGHEVSHLAPEPFFGRLYPGTSGVGKWLSYLDKYLVFPGRLRRAVRGIAAGGVVHIADHSNAMYVQPGQSAGHSVVVTCHDLGAVRGALGEDTDCPASATGKVLQRWIAHSLGQADGIGCVSGATQQDVQRLIRRPDRKALVAPVIFNGFNAPYGKLEAEAVRKRLSEDQSTRLLADVPFALNVGSGLSRKNRAGVLRIFAETKAQWKEGWLVFAGEALTEPEIALAKELGVAERVAQVVKPSDKLLEALYNRATCLLFPSKFEGFGWPAIEAQACGCPVLCSDAGALGEVAGGGAFARDWRDEGAFAAELARLATNEAARGQLAERGFANVERFRTKTMIENYRRLYAEVNGSVAASAAGVEVGR